jgi:hypothetical protein
MIQFPNLLIFVKPDFKKISKKYIRTCDVLLIYAEKISEKSYREFTERAKRNDLDLEPDPHKNGKYVQRQEF